MYISRFLSNQSILISVFLILPHTSFGKSLIGNKNDSAELFDDDDGKKPGGSSKPQVLMLAGIFFGIFVFIVIMLKVFQWCVELENRESRAGAVDIVSVTTQHGDGAFPRGDRRMRQTDGEPSIWDLFNNLPPTPEEDPSPPYPATQAQECSISNGDGGYSSSVESLHSRVSNNMPNPDIEVEEPPPPSYYEVTARYGPSSSNDQQEVATAGASQYRGNNLNAS